VIADVLRGWSMHTYAINLDYRLDHGSGGQGPVPIRA
jgi:hypothetical protein